jgi:hypothetical protein
MNIVKRIAKVFFWVLIIALLISPLGILYEISQREMAEYQVHALPALAQTSIGRVLQVTRQDVQEYFTVSGVFQSSESAYQPLTMENPGLIRWEVTSGDEIQAGQVMGTYNGENVVAQFSGIIEKINTGSADPYVKVKLLDKLVLEATVSKSTLAIIKRSMNMTTEAGESVRLTYTSNLKSANGDRRIQLTIDSEDYSYGTSVNLKIYTGLSYPQVLVVHQDCVYQRNPGSDNPWYVRTVTKNGEVIGEQKVEIAFTMGNMVCISGVAEGTYCDAGYKDIVGG